MFESILIRLLTWLGDNLSAEQSLWYEAILAESAAIQSAQDRMQWLSGGVFLAIRAHAATRIRAMVVDAEGRRLPTEVILVAAYQCLFSLVLLGLLVFQLPRITERWTDAVPALSIMFLVIIVPGVLGFGLLVLDNSARWGTLAFSIIHAMLAWRRFSGSPVHPMMPIIRIAFDAFIIAVLIRPAIVRRFIHRQIQLKLV